MDIEALRDAVIEETGRTEKSAMIERAVKAMILKAHEIEYFPQDRKENTFTPTSVDTKTSETLPTRWRKFALIEPLSSLLARLDRKFTEKDPDNIFSFEGDVLPGYYYVLGSNVIIEDVDTIQKLHWIWYEYPDLSTITKTTWITDRYEQELIDGAVGYVLRKLGDNTYKGYEDMWIREHTPRIRRENLLSGL